MIVKQLWVVSGFLFPFQHISQVTHTCDGYIFLLHYSVEGNNETFKVDYYNPDGNGPPNTLVQEYSRPSYTYVGGVEGLEDEDGTYWLTYTGSRWFGMYFNLAEMNKTLEDLLIATQEFHGTTILLNECIFDMSIASWLILSCIF